MSKNYYAEGNLKKIWKRLDNADSEIRLALELLNNIDEVKGNTKLAKSYELEWLEQTLEDIIPFKQRLELLISGFDKYKLNDTGEIGTVYEIGYDFMKDSFEMDPNTADPDKVDREVIIREGLEQAENDDIYTLVERVELG